MSRFRLLSLPLLAAAAIAGCGGGDESTSAGSTSASAQDCTPEQLQTHEAGTLTVATDKPAYPPYFEDNDPTNGQGFESAVGYAIADQLGFTEDQVEWATVPFNSSFAP
ncbi:MAG: amino acid ABC transporter substrate-binding protein, partial [Solirubrobacterales bacterium]